MIEIREISPPRKLSGLSSFLLKFPYNPQIVDVIKSFSPAVFDKKNLTWEISSSYLSQLLDQLTYLDDIQLTLLPGEIKEISDFEGPTVPFDDLPQWFKSFIKQV